MMGNLNKALVLSTFLAASFIGIDSAAGLCSKQDPNLPLNSQIKIAEVRPSDAGDDNGWITLKNVSGECLDLAGWVLYDGNLEHELFITRENTEGFSDGLLLAPGSEAKVFPRGDQDFILDAGGGKIELYSGPAEMLGGLQDEVLYPKITTEEAYHVINTPSTSVETGAVEEEHNYQIPEKTNNESRIVNQRENKDGKEKEKSKEKEKNKLENKPQLSSGAGKSDNQAAQQSGRETMEQESNEPAPFLASVGKEKSSWRWLYFFWNSWFLWRIILPFLVLWAGLYYLACFIRRKYLS